MSTLEESVVNAAGSNSTIWTFEQFADHLNSIGISSLSDVEQLKAFIMNKPKLFTVSSNYLWSKSGTKVVAISSPNKDVQLSWKSVMNLMNQAVQSPENSERLRLDVGHALFFKIPWIFGRLSRHRKSIWKSYAQFLNDFKLSSDFVHDIGCTHVTIMAEALENCLDPDSIARMVVDTILDMNGAGIDEDIFARLPIEARVQLKSSKGLQGFSKFYPALFTSFEQVLAIVDAPVFMQPSKSITEPEREDPALNAVNYLLSNAHPDVENSKVYVFQNVDAVFMKIKWLLQHMPKNVAARFTNFGQLRSLLSTFPNTYIIVGNHVQSRKNLEEVPCEKSVALEILKLQRNHRDMNDNQIVQSLDFSKRNRIPSGKCLAKFRLLHDTFFAQVISNDWVIDMRKTLEATMQNTTNSMRAFTLSGKHAILFQSKWVYDNFANITRSKTFGSIGLFLHELKSLPEVELGYGLESFHLKKVLEERLSPERLARILVNYLLENPRAFVQPQMIFGYLSPKVKSSLVDANGLREFSRFYPALFVLNEDGLGISLRNAPIKETVAPSGKGSFIRNGGPDQNKVNAIINLLTNSHPDAENSSVFVVEQISKPYFKLDWILEKVPSHYLFSTKQDLLKTVRGHPDIFVVVNNHVNLKATLNAYTCEKSLALEILKIQKKHPTELVSNMLTRIPKPFQRRVRSNNELLKFVAIHSEFLEPCKSQPDLYNSAFVNNTKPSEALQEGPDLDFWSDISDMAPIDKNYGNGGSGILELP